MSRRERQQAIIQMVDQGRALHIAGRKDEAEKIFRDVMALDANNAEAMHRIGLLMVDRGDLLGALPLMQRSLGLAPLVPELHNNMGELYRKAGMAGEARACFLRAIELRGNFLEAVNNLALTLVDIGAHGDAVRAAQLAVKLAPLEPQVHYTLGISLASAHRDVEAVVALKEAIRLKPDFEEAKTRLVLSRAAAGELFDSIVASAPAGLTPAQIANFAACGYCGQGRYELAEPLVDRLLAEEPKNPYQLLYKGGILKDRGDTAGAVKYYEESFACGGGHGAKFNMALCNLKLGRLKEGFAGYELRQLPAQPRDGGAPRPMWDGSDPRGKTILITHEQGYGDTFMFIRYAALLADRGARVWVQAHQAIHDLLSTAPGISRLLQPGEEARGFQYVLPIVSFAHAFSTELETIPANVPYLTADPAKAAKWREKISALSPDAKFRVGLVWQGNPTHVSDHLRSMPLSAMSPLGEIPGVKLFSLQKGKGSEQVGQPGTPALIDLSDGLSSFMETASAMQSLDLVIAVDTGVIHLAGALGRPVWSMHAISADFRWLEGRSDSPWYPTMRLYRQKAIQDWSGVVADVARDLAELAAKKG